MSLLNRNGCKVSGITQSQRLTHKATEQELHISLWLALMDTKWEIAKPAQPAMVCQYGSGEAAQPFLNHAGTGVILAQHRPCLYLVSLNCDLQQAQVNRRTQ